MRTMTCRQLGGPCDHAHTGATADDVIKAQDQHLREAVAGDDAAHVPALEAMTARWQDPQAGMGWYQETQATFAGLPED